MKKIPLILLLLATCTAKAQSIVLDPSLSQNNNTTRTLTNKYGISHTDGTIVLNTYLNNVPTGQYYGAWLQTRTNHPLIFTTNDGDAQAFFQPSGNIIFNPWNGKSGNVGIGLLKESVPAEKLEVNGDVRIRGLQGTGNRKVRTNSDGKLFPVSSTGAYTISGLDFVESNGDMSKNIAYTHDYGIYVRNNTYVTLMAPIHLPDGVVLKEVTAKYLDNSAERHLSFRLYRQTNGLSGTDKNINLFHTPVGRQTDVHAYVTSAFAENEVVNSRLYSYFLIVLVVLDSNSNSTALWTGQNMQINNVVVKFEE
jgi:hypothetical protein